MRTPLWTVVLAAGKGRRLAGVTSGVPKQFWAPGDRPSFLETTLRRTSPLSVPVRTFVIVDRSHGPWVDALPQVHRMGRVVFQDGDRGTAAGVLLGVHRVLAHAPNGIVLVTPSDHGIANEPLFRQGICRAVAAIERRRAGVVLFGVAPSGPSADYGWITPATSTGGTAPRMAMVSAFVEKPTDDTASRLFAAGAVWNSMVLVARASQLAALFDRHLPRMSEAFAAARLTADGVPPYADLAPADLSRDVLVHAEGVSLYTWPAALGWSDLGTPERLSRWRDATRREPAFATAAAPFFERRPRPGVRWPPTEIEVPQWPRFARFSYRRTSATRPSPPISTLAIWH